MAQLGTQRLAETDQCTTPTSQNFPTFEQVIHDEEAVWQPNRSPVRKNHEQEDDHTAHNKKSVFTKVKEKAKEFTYSFSGKNKWQHESQDDNNTPPWGVTLEDLEDDEGDDNPENLGAPTYESELAPNTYKNATSRHHQEAAGRAVAKKDGICAASTRMAESGRDGGSAVDNSREDGSAIAGARAIDTGKNAGTGMFDFEGNSKTREHGTNMNMKTWDKGVSVKEYLKQQLEPGEDERALSQVISNAISPRNSSDDTGMVGKVKDAVVSLLRPEQEPSHSSTKTTESSSNDTVSRGSSQPTSNTNSYSHGSPAPIKENSYLQISHSTNSSLHVPVSTNPHEAVQEENREKILQEN